MFRRAHSRRRRIWAKATCWTTQGCQVDGASPLRDVKERWSCIALVGKTEQKSTAGNSDKEKTYEILGSNIITAAPYVSVNSKSRSS